jgi:hypothetical protein
VMFKSGDCAGQGRCWSSPSHYSNHGLTVLAVWMGAMSSWKAASLFGSHLSTYSLAVIRPWRVVMGQTEYPIPPQNLPHDSLLELGILDWRLPWVFSKCKLFLM